MAKKSLLLIGLTCALRSAGAAESGAATFQTAPTEFTITGACDAQDHLDGTHFTLMGHTASGAPYYKAVTGGKYIYWDPDCMSSSDGTPRWIIDTSAPSTTREHDLDGDGFCDYIGRINTGNHEYPPKAAYWTMNCAGRYRQVYLIMHGPDERSTSKQAQITIAPSTSAAPPSSKSTTAGHDHPATTTTHQRIVDHRTSMPHLATTVGHGHGSEHTLPKVAIHGACDAKAFVSNNDWEQMGETADGRPYYKAEHTEQYLYYEPDCDGPEGPNHVARWIFDSSKPSTTAHSNLDGDGECDYHARCEGSEMDPAECTGWKMYCGDHDGWTDTYLHFAPVDAEATTTPAEAILSSGAYEWRNYLLTAAVCVLSALL